MFFFKQRAADEMRISDWSSGRVLCRSHAAKADVARRAVDMLRMPRRRAVALAIVDGAQMRSALHNLAADARAGGRIVIALRERRTARVGDRAAGRFGPRALRDRKSTRLNSSH